MSLSPIPQNVVLQSGNGQNYVTWDLVAGATSYNVLRSTDGVTFASVGTPATNSYLDSSVTVGTTYYYQVESVTTSGTSPAAPSYPASIVPCLPGQINLGYIRYQAKLKADKLNSQFLTTDEWNFNINQSMFELYDILVTKYGDDYFVAAPYVFSTTGAANYSLPDGSASFQVNGSTAPALYKLIGVDCGVSVGNNAFVTLPRFNWIDRNKFIYPQLQANALGVFNLSYRQMGNNLEFIPRPTAGQFIQVWYVPVMSQLLQDTDMLSFSISGWSEYVIVDAAIKALLKEESYDQAQALQVLKASLLERIETTAANKDVGQPNTISDTRTNTGFFDGSGFGGTGHGQGGWGLLFLPIGISNNIGHSALTNSVSISQTLLTMVAFGVAFSYLVYKNPGEFRRWVRFSRTAKLFWGSLTFSALRDHVSNVIKTGTKE